MAYVDFLLDISFHPQAIMEGVNIKFNLKDDTYGPNFHYLGTVLYKTITDNGPLFWTKFPDTYLQDSIEQIE